MATRSWDVVIVGGGHNGLACASYLARGGLTVLVLERLERLGGAVATEEVFPGFRPPYCAYICYLMQDKIIQDLQLHDHGFATYPMDAFLFNPFPDGSRLISWSEKERTFEEVRRFSERDADAYLAWMDFWERAAALVHRYLFRSPPTFAEVARDVAGTPDEEVWERMLTMSMRDLVDEYFEDDHVKAAFIHAHDAGDPSAPGSIFAVAYPRMSLLGNPENTGIPRGGMGAVAQAMARAARARNVELRTNAPVRKILIEDGRAIGVVLESGEVVRASTVVSNADPKRTYLSLVGPEQLDPAFVHKVTKLTTRAGCVKVLAALKELPDFRRYLGDDYDPRIAAYTKICPSVDYFQAAWDDCKSGRIPKAPILNVQIPSVYDPTLAPEGMHVLSSWSLYYPADLKEGTWEEAKKTIAEQHLAILSEYAPNFRRSVIDLVVNTPRDIESRIGMTDGNIRHIDMVPAQFFSRRMPYRSPIPGLYLCGAGTHPGGEVTAAPGHNCAQAILADRASGSTTRS
jgi:phytoene dehydrogenase-like protein